MTNNYANTLVTLKRFEEAKALFCKTIPVARRVLGVSDDLTLRMRKISAEAIYFDASATLDDLREAAVTLGEMARIARRVFGGAHPTTGGMEYHLRIAMRAALRARGGNG